MEVMDPPPVTVARPKPKRMRYIVAGGLCVAAVLYLVVGGLSSNIVYFRTVKEAADAHDKAPADTSRLRIAGAVVPGTVQRRPDGVSFVVTDGVRKARIVHHGDPPELFKDGAPVVCEGHFDKGDTGPVPTFESDRIMIKHGAEYRPPSVDVAK